MTHELILGVARSGQSRCPEARAAAWLARPGHSVLLIATALAADASREQEALLHALAAAPGPVVLVSNEIGLGVLPVSPEARGGVDALGRLHQRVAAACARVTLMVAGIEVQLKGQR